MNTVVSTLTQQVIVGVDSHDEHQHDSKTLESGLSVAHQTRRTDIELAIVDRGYRGVKQHVDIDVRLPSPPLKRDSDYQRRRKRILCRKRAAIEPIIGHLKHDYRLTRNGLKGSQGDSINLLMAATAWNLRKWMTAFFLLQIKGQLWVLIIAITHESTGYAQWIDCSKANQID